MVTLAIDYAWQHPDPRQIANAGYKAVFRYLSADPTKNITVAEAQALHAVGLGIALVWETEAQRALIGSAGGVADAQNAVREAVGIGYGKLDLILVNIGDWAVQENQLGNLTMYYSAFRSIIIRDGYASGGYGTGYVIDKMVASGFNDFYWQNAIDDGGEPGSNVNPHASIYQRVKPTLNLAGSYDEDVILKPIPLWGPATIPGWGQPPHTPANPPSNFTYPAFPGRLIHLTNPLMNGNDIRTWQERMAQRKWTITVDGVYGPKSETICRQFQQEKGLTVDGIIGPKTWDAAWTLPIT